MTGKLWVITSSLNSTFRFRFHIMDAVLTVDGFRFAYWDGMCCAQDYTSYLDLEANIKAKSSNLLSNNRANLSIK
jgi:hypothetical protein